MEASHTSTWWAGSSALILVVSPGDPTDTMPEPVGAIDTAPPVGESWLVGGTRFVPTGTVSEVGPAGGVSTGGIVRGDEHGLVVSPALFTATLIPIVVASIKPSRIG